MFRHYRVILREPVIITLPSNTSISNAAFELYLLNYFKCICWLQALASNTDITQTHPSACNTDTTQTQPHQISNTQRTENKTTGVVIQQHSRKLLMIDILMSETC